jgi:alcohol dehydrogenase class IV
MIEKKNINKFKNLIKNKKKILIVAGKKSYYKSKSNIFIDSILKDKNRTYFFKSGHYPNLKEIKKLKDLINKFYPDIIIAIGGGSVIDTAKISNIIVIKDKNFSTQKKFTNLVAIPLTAGSGAEVTSTAVVYIEKKKTSIETDQVIPDNYFLFPQLLLNAPKKIKGSSIFDCIAQAVESIFSLKSNDKSFYYAVKSLKISLNYYLKYYENPNFINAKQMLLASNYAGKAINISRTIASHAISYPFTALFNISHGKAVSITFTEILRYNYINCTKTNLKLKILKKYKLLFKLTKTKNINKLILFFEKIIKNLDIKINLKSLKINLDINWKNIKFGINYKRLQNNPVYIDIKSIKKILDIK